MYLYYKLSKNLVDISNGGKKQKFSLTFFLNITDPNGNTNQLNSIADYNELPSISKRSSQQSSTNQTNTMSSSSQQNR
jgi:hypothetical protein